MTVAWLCVNVCTVMYVSMQAQSQSGNLATPFASVEAVTTANRRLPLVAQGVKLLSDCLSKSVPPAVKARGLKGDLTV